MLLMFMAIKPFGYGDKVDITPTN